MYELPKLPRAAALLSLLAAAACSGGGGGGTTPPPPPATGTISGSVTRTGTGVDGATIAITGGASVVSAGGGNYSLANVTAGAKTLTITPPANHAVADGETAAKSVTVVGGQTATVNWALKSTSPAPGVTIVNMNGASFDPDAVTIGVGSAVRWVNVTATPHTITPNNAGQAGAWGSQNINGNGTTFQHTFNTAGTFDYHCNIHAGMTGRVTVN
jgi:plastocyanin